jgi:hypothetical protein
MKFEIEELKSKQDELIDKVNKIILALQAITGADNDE